MRKMLEGKLAIGEEVFHCDTVNPFKYFIGCDRIIRTLIRAIYGRAAQMQSLVKYDEDKSA